MSEVMNSRERGLAAVTGKQPDRLPGFCGRIDDLEYWLSGFSVGSEEELRGIWGLDCRKSSYANIFHTEPEKTIWGCEDNWDAGYSSNKIPPLAEAATITDIEKHPWPTIGQFDLNEMSRQIEQLDDGYAKIGSVGFQALLCTLFDLFGMETTMINMHVEPRFIEASVERIEHFLLTVIDQILRKHAKDLDFFWWGDDFSTQRGMMISPDMWRKFLKPTYSPADLTGISSTQRSPLLNLNSILPSVSFMPSVRKVIDSLVLNSILVISFIPNSDLASNSNTTFSV